MHANFLPKPVALLMLMTVALSCAGANADVSSANPPTLAELRSGERALVVGGVANFGRFNFDAAGQSGEGAEQLGMDREIMRVLVQALGVKRVDFVTMNFGELEDALLSGRIDVIANNYWITPERQQKMSFTRPYYAGGGIASLFGAGGEYFDEPSKMSGRRVATLARSHSAGWSRQHIPDAVIIELTGLGEMDDMLRTGQADVLIGPATMFAESALASRGEDLYLYSILEPMQAALALRQGSAELVAAFDGVLASMEQDGSLAEIVKRDNKTLEAVSAQSIPE